MEEGFLIRDDDPFFAQLRSKGNQRRIRRFLAMLRKDPSARQEQARLYANWLLSFKRNEAQPFLWESDPLEIERHALSHMEDVKGISPELLPELPQMINALREIIRRSSTIRARYLPRAKIIKFPGTAKAAHSS